MHNTIGKLNAREKWYGFLFVSPMVIGFAVFLLGPMIGAFVMSLTDWSLIRDPSFIGFGNYAKAFNSDPRFWKAVWNTFYFSIVLVPLNLSLALSLALLIRDRIPGISFFRTGIFTPVVTTLVVWAIVWKYIFATDGGLANDLLQSFGIPRVQWLYSFTWTMPVVIVVSVLKNVGMNMIIFLAALNDVPAMYHEAARIDGASNWQRFWKITLPLIAPAIFLTMIITFIGSLKVFAQIYIMTEGGPGGSTSVLVYYIYQQAFRLYEFGYASAIAFILFMIIMAVTLFQWHMRKKWVHHEQ